MDLCAGLTVGLTLFGLPVPLCWSGAVFAARTIRDLPIGFSVAADVLLTGVQLALIWLFLSIPALLTAAVGLFFAFLWPDSGPAGGPPPGLVASAAGFVFAAVTWLWFRPIASEEWHRLTR